MLRVSKLTDYATVIMAFFARDPQRQRSAMEVAAGVGLALPTVSKVLKKLAGGRLLATTRGVNGGYGLARPVAEISLTHIIETMEGPVGMTECGAAPGLCAQESDCDLRISWRRVNRLVLNALNGVTLADMVSPQLRSMRLVVSKPPTSGRAANE